MKRLAGLICVAIVALPLSTRANPIDAFGFGARGPGMGQAQTAAADDGGAVYYNPALLADFTEIRVDIGYQYARPSLSINGLDNQVDPARGTLWSLAAPGELWGRRLAFGAALFLPDSHVSRIRTLAPSQPRFQLYDNRAQRIFLASAVALRVTDWLALGVGVAYMSGTQGEVELAGRIGFPNEDDSDLRLAIDVDLKTVRYAHAGVLVDVNPWLRLGASYRSRFRVTIDQLFHIRGDIGSEGLEPIVEDGFFTLRTISESLFQPATSTLGTAVQLTSSVLATVDIAYQQWSALNNPAANLTIELDVGEFNDLVDLAEIDNAHPSPSFRDIVVARFGAEWHLTPDYAIRGGYAYEPSPAPEQVGRSNFVDNDKHTWSLGFGAELRPLTHVFNYPIRIDAFAAATWLPRRSHTKLSPVDPVGDYAASGFVLQTGLTTQLRF